MLGFLSSMKNVLGLLAELVLHPFQVPDDFYDIFDDGEGEL